MARQDRGAHPLDRRPADHPDHALFHRCPGIDRTGGGSGVSLKAIAEYSDRIEAEMARLALAAEGIDAHVFDGGMAGLGLGFMTPARLMVLPEDAAEARIVLEKHGQA
nr:DUF2007 domain-containing protein [Sphingomonas ursincola]